MIADAAGSLTTWWGPALALVAGMVSFASPCVMPLVPGYLSFITADTAVSGPVAAAGKRRNVVPIVLFVLGFTVVFVMLGAFATTFVRAFKSTTGQVIAGSIMVALGLLLIGYAFGRGRLSLYAERRPFLQRVRPGTAGAFPLGMAFAAGWTPCIGPVLAGILAIAATQSAPRGAFLLFWYGMGLGVPFILIGLGVQRLVGAMDAVKRHYKGIAVVSGLLLMGVGVLVIQGTFTRLLAPLLRYTPGL